MTTVGYGDIYPETDLGRVIGMTVMVVGIGFGSLLIGTVAERFVRPGVRAEAEHVDREVEATEADLLRELQALSRRLVRVEEALARRQR